MTPVEYVPLGRTGLKVSRLGLGTNMFGTQRGWGLSESRAKEVFDRFLEQGGNFIDTANVYTNGESESILGHFLADPDIRDRVVLASKFSFSTVPSNPNAEGNGRKNLIRSLEQSLERLGTAYLDLYWLHWWDEVTSPEEVVLSLNHLVEAGKIRYYGLSNIPAWFAARAHEFAVDHGKEPPAALQVEYSLINRRIESEHLPAARSMGMGVCPYFPLASGFLSGKYDRSHPEETGRGRLDHPAQSTTAKRRFSDRNWRILDVVRSVGAQLGRPVAQVALNWVATASGITSPLVGATRPDQVDENLGALDFVIPTKLREQLDAVSTPEPAEE